MITIEEENLIGQMVEVDENPEMIHFVGNVVQVSENDIDGVLISIIDSEDNCWDIEPKYVRLYE